MRETRPGHYEGEYLVSVGTNLTDAPIFVRLVRNAETALAEAPHALTIVTTPPSVKETAPGDGARINVARPNIFAAFSSVSNRGMDPASLRMKVNGSDVTAQTTRTPSFISFYPPAGFRPGRVEVEVKGTDIAGNSVEYAWTFVIGQK
jgi:hypothetical protein